MLDTAKESKEFDMVKKADKHVNDPKQDSDTKTNPTKTENTVIPYTGVWCMEGASQDVGS